MMNNYVTFLFLIIALITKFTIGLNLGENYFYQYNAKVSTKDETQNAQNVGYHVSVDVHVGVVWQDVERQEKLLKLQLENLEYRLSKESSPKIPVSTTPFYVQKIGTKIGNVYFNPKMDFFYRGMYKGIASILQYETDNVEILEQDVSGTCKVSYFRNDGRVEKVKNYCKSEKPTLRTDSLRSISVNFDSRTIYNLDSNGDMQDATVDESIDIASNLWTKGKAAIKSQTTMKRKNEVSKTSILSDNRFEDAIESIKKTHNAELFKDTIYGGSDDTGAKSNSHSNVASVVKSYQKYLRTENLATLSSASTFLKLLKYFKGASGKDIEEILDNKKLQSIQLQILDIVAFAASTEAIEVVFKKLQDKKDTDLMERFLLGLSLIHHPTNEIINQVMKFLKTQGLEDKIKASALSTLGALTKNAQAFALDNKVLESAVQILVNGYKECTSEECSLMYLRGLRNAALLNTRSMLIAVVNKEGRQALEAARAIQNIGFQNQPLECQRFCDKILKQQGQDASTKAIVAEILLECSLSDTALLKNILAALDLEKPTEYSAFVASKLMRKVDENEQLRLHVLNLLSDKDIKNYFSIFQKGSSASFIKPLISTGEINSTYGVDMEMLSGGLLKKTSFDIKMKNENDELHLLSVGMFAEGLGSFVGESSEEETPRAGLELGVFGVALRPYVFFESSSELMGHVWSGTASEPTPAVQGNILITDHSEVVILQNGLKAHLQSQGALSADLSGAVQISIWSRNSNSQVQNGVALLVTNSVTVEGIGGSLESEIKYRGETAIDFLSYFEFHEEPYKMCLQMMLSEFQFLIDRRKVASLNNGKLVSRRHKKSKLFIPARSYLLHQKNSELCSQILQE